MKDMFEMYLKVIMRLHSAILSVFSVVSAVVCDVFSHCSQRCESSKCKCDENFHSVKRGSSNYTTCVAKGYTLVNHARINDYTLLFSSCK